MLKNRNFSILMLGVFIAELGIWFGLIGNLDFLQDTVSSSLLQAMILLVGVFFGALLGPLAGRIIDQFDKKKILIYCGLARICAVGFMFIALELHSVWWMIGYNLIIGISAAFYFPTLQALIPVVVDEKDLLAANSMQTNAITIARIVGAGLAGLLLVSMSLSVLYVIALCAYIFLFITTLLLKFADQKEAGTNGLNKAKEKASFIEVFHVIKSKSIVTIALVLIIVPYLFLAGFNLMVIAISDLQESASIKGILYTVEGLFIMLGAFLIKIISRNNSRLLMMLVMGLLIGVAHISLYFAEITWMSILSFALFGFALGGFLPLATTIHQTEVPKAFHGRFFSFKRMVESIVYQVLMVLTGLMLDTVGFHSMVLMFGSISIILVIFMMLRQFMVTSIKSDIAQ